MKKLYAIFLLLILHCVQYTKYTPDPEKDIEKWINNFTQQKSFSYHYKLQTHSVSTEARGDCVVGRGERIRGLWNYSDRTLTFEYIGLGDIEYSKIEGKWQESSRGEESDVLTQIERLLEFDKYEYIGSAREFVYYFKANIPFLAPGRWKEMIGVIKISARNYLPEIIWAGLPDSSLYWQINLYDYNKKKNIKPPVRDRRDYSLVFSGDHVKAIKKRLKLIGVDYSLKKKGENVILSMPKHYTLDDIRTMLGTKTLNVYRQVLNKEEATKVGYLRNDISMPMYLAERLLSQNDIKDAKIKFDVVSEPYLEILVRKKFVPPTDIAFEIDSIIYGTAALDTSKKIDRIRLYTDMHFYEMEVLRASLLQTLPVVDLKLWVEERN